MRQLLALLLLSCATASAEPRCARGSVRVDSDNKRIEVELSNTCESLVTCKVSWRLTCGHEAAQDKSEDIRLDGHKAEHVTASASSCGDSDWYIAPPKWRCEETTPIRDGDKPHMRHARRFER